MRKGNKARFKAFQELQLLERFNYAVEEDLQEGISDICSPYGGGNEDHLVLRDFEDVFREIPRLPPKRDIDFSIDLVPRADPVSKTP
jgi:hypothetical protein